jgi:hypothetical protein
MKGAHRFASPPGARVRTRAVAVTARRAEPNHCQTGIACGANVTGSWSCCRAAGGEREPGTNYHGEPAVFAGDPYLPGLLTRGIRWVGICVRTRADRCAFGPRD